MKQSHIAVIGAPMDLGAGRRGVDMGPSALRLAGLNEKLTALGYEVEDLGNVLVAQPESLPVGNPGARYLLQIAQTCTRLAEMVENAADDGHVPVVLGGDHSVAIGTVSGMSRHFRKSRLKLGLIWMDAHADMNTPTTSPSGNVHGMPLACCIGLGPPELIGIGGPAPQIDPGSVALIGLRSVDDVERFNVRGAGVHPFTMRDIDERGLPSVIQEAIDIVTAGTAGFHLLFDMDAVDPREAPGVGTPVRGGITYREAHLIMEAIADTGYMASMEVAEVNPILDVRNASAEFAAGLIASSMGKRIL